VDAEPDRALWAAGLAGFALLVCVWWLTLQYGSTGVPMFGANDLPDPMRWLLCGGAALYFAVMLLVGVRGGAPRPARCSAGRCPRWRCRSSPASSAAPCAPGS